MNKKLQSIIILFAFFTLSSTMSVRAQSALDTASHFLTATPNPFEDRLEIRVKETSPVIKFIKITDIIGNQVAFLDVSDRALPINFHLDFSGLKQGLYLCNVYSDKGLVETKRLYRNK